jgi:hypothetical protein
MVEKQTSKLMAYTLVNTELLESSKVLGGIRKFENVIEVCPIFGIYDNIAHIKADSTDELKETRKKIKKLDKVRTTLDMSVLVDTKRQPIGFKKDATTGEIMYENTPDLSEYRIPE